MLVLSSWTTSERDISTTQAHHGQALRHPEEPTLLVSSLPERRSAQTERHGNNHACDMKRSCFIHRSNLISSGLEILGTPMILGDICN